METDKSDEGNRVRNNYVSLDEYKVGFSAEVEEFFSQRIGQDELYANLNARHLRI